MARTSTGHVIPGLPNDALTDASLAQAYRAVNEALSVPDGTLSMRELVTLDRRREAIKAEQERRQS